MENTLSREPESMKKKLLVLVFFLFIVAMAAGYFAFKGRNMEQHAASGASTYALTKEELERLQEKARRGDCDAAFRIATFHSYFTAKFEESIRWGRFAVRCPGVRQRELLVAMLLNTGSVDSVTGEVEGLIADMRKTDVAAADRAQNEFTRIRKASKRN
jgi:hypothetical protein